MSLPILVKTLVEQKLEAFCKKRVSPRVADKLRLSFASRGRSVTIFENRAPWRPELTEWTSMPIAQIRYDEKTGKWALYWADRNDRWHKYEGLPPTREIDKILAEIDSDPTGIFWG
ncbi:MAG: DUF3024 domain-containing protein [Nitrospirae bacterium]|nr:DUF3024 domain-containing protein [Nitrospirota bacterium]